MSNRIKFCIPLVVFCLLLTSGVSFARIVTDPFSPNYGGYESSRNFDQQIQWDIENQQRRMEYNAAEAHRRNIEMESYLNRVHRDMESYQDYRNEQSRRILGY